MPLIATLFNPGMRERHWVQVSDIVGFPLRPDEDMSLSKLIDFLNLDNFVPSFEGISEAAGKEYALERALEKMKTEWAPVSSQAFLYRLEFEIELDSNCRTLHLLLPVST